VSSLFGSQQQAPTPPQPEYVNTRDEIGGTQSNYVTNPDGTKTLVTTRLPLTPEQQAYEAKLKEIETTSLDWINKLTTNFDINDPSLSWLKNEVDNYKTTQVKGADQANQDRSQQEETMLARFGQADSSAGVALREQRGKDYTNTRDQIERDAAGIQNNLKQQALGNATNLYSLASGRMDTQLGQLMDSLKTGQNFQLSDAQLQNNRNLAVYNGTIQQNANSGGFGNLMALAQLGTYALGKQGFNVFGRK